MEQNRKQSTRLWLLVIGIGIAVLREVSEHYGLSISMETLMTIEGLLLATAGLDTYRPLGLRDNGVEEEEEEEEEEE
jgi:Na+/H+-translocating membrane pyrophosphatase